MPFEADIDFAMQSTSPQPSYTYHPTVYLRAMHQFSPVLPWLFDLNRSACLRKEAEKPDGREWDWERLLRRLTQDDIYQNPVCVEGIPPGLQNRRRIWKMVEDWLAPGYLPDH